MKEKILALLEQKFQGKRKDGLNRLAGAIALQVSTEDEANTIVGKITAENVDAFITDWRKEADAEISKANKTYEEGLRKKYDFTEKKTEQSAQQTEKTEGSIDAAAIQKIVSEAVAAATKPLLEKVSVFEAGNTAKTRLETLNDKLKECKDETFKAKILKDFARMKFETDNEFTEYLTDTEFYPVRRTANFAVLKTKFLLCCKS
ncbi:MAG: hypothetical protein LBP85_05685 [Prevotellaceae bacterium]|jgi:hypothetical protein|nr:hypothetical protein [Prevotellaceae bacterium]